MSSSQSCENQNMSTISDRVVDTNQMINNNNNNNNNNETHNVTSQTNIDEQNIIIEDVKQDEKSLSKNQLKKRRRYEKLMSIKKRKKELNKERKAIKAKAEGRDLKAERKHQEENRLSGDGHLKREKKWLKRIKPAESSFKVCIDCSFEDLMSTKEIGSLSNQIRYCYAANKKSYHPVHLSVSSLSGKTYENLKRVEGFPDNWRTRGFECSDKALTEVHAKDDLVYLSSDSDDTLLQLDNSKVYVIGGIVDRNRLKGVTAKKANELGISTAKLPIDEHLKLCATRVLTCNHVFEILLKFKEHKNWKEALLSVLPARKDVALKQDLQDSMICSSSNDVTASS